MHFLVAEPNPDMLAKLLAGIAQGDRKSPETVTECDSHESVALCLSDFNSSFHVLVIGPGFDHVAGEICHEARSLNENLHILRILSAYSNEAHRQAIKAGADDVASSDRLPGTLEMRLLPVRTAHARRKIDLDQLAYAQKTAFTAMSSMGEIGVILEFLRQSFACSDPVSVANLLLDSCERYELKGIVRISTQEGTHVYSRSGMDDEAEVAVMRHVQSSGRIFEFADRGAYNFTKTSLVVIGMPRTDPDRCGRLRDNLALLVEAADAKILSMEMETVSRQRSHAIQSAQNGILMNMRLTRDLQKIKNEQALTFVNGFKLHMEEILLRLSLMPDQEGVVMNAVYHYTDELLKLHKTDLSAMDDLESLASMLSETGGAIGANPGAEHA